MKPLAYLCCCLALLAGAARADDPKPIPARVANRSFPSMFQAWNGVENRPDLSELERIALHDLAFLDIWGMRLQWRVDRARPHSGLSTTLADQHGKPDFVEPRRRRERLRALNPNLLTLCELRYREGRWASTQPVELWKSAHYPPNSDLWLRDEHGALCPGWGEDTDGDGTVERDEIQFMLVDFTNPKLREILAQKALALKESGVFDGVMLDWWNEDHATSGRWPDWNGTILTREQEIEARLGIVRAIREKVGDDFLILVNSNDRTVPRSAPSVNGLFMECYKSDHRIGYTLKQIEKIEQTLRWAEANLREPRINCLEGWREVQAYPADLETRVRERDNETNSRWMRMFTALALTQSNGYALFADDNALPVGDHLHNWHAFWDADLGRPTATGQRRPDGAWTREFTNGLAVYNPPSNEPVTLQFDRPRASVALGRPVREIQMAPGDGDILLKVSD